MKNREGGRGIFGGFHGNAWKQPNEARDVPEIAFSKLIKGCTEESNDATGLNETCIHMFSHMGNLNMIQRIGYVVAMATKNGENGYFGAFLVGKGPLIPDKMQY